VIYVMPAPRRPGVSAVLAGLGGHLRLECTTLALEARQTSCPSSTEGKSTPVGQQADTQAARFGFTTGQVVQEFGWDDDVDEPLRTALEAALGGELVDEDYDDVTDAVLVWWRDDDGDLTDMLVDAQTALEDGGKVWLLTRKPGRDGHVGHDEIQEAATTAGLHATSTFAAGDDWSATRLANRGR
jgi:hypothetical protein